ncbi:MAG: von Willebrand factor type A domain-containing protein [Puia sp.]|nr:von Willebrand factor type A domain-containing protein [Puia sp.]
MKNVAIIIACFCLHFSSSGQYYLRGEVKDEANVLLSNVKILLHSSGYLYYSGSSGGFGIPVPQTIDSISVSADGFEPLSIRVDATHYQAITLKSLHPLPSARTKRLLSFTKNLKPEDWRGWTVGAETYSSLLENQFIPASRFPETGFAMTIDKASYSNVRRFLNMGSTIPPDAVRIEELLNYFNLGYTPPPADSNFIFNSYLSDCPWNAGNKLLFLHVCAKKLDLAKVPPANLVFLIDVSGSMDMPNKLPLLKSAFRLLVNNLRDKDTVSIVVYGSTVAVWLPPTSGKEKTRILQSIEDLYPGGPTPGEAGIRMAYRLAKSQLIKGGNNRVVLATDGDFNVGENSEDALENLITEHKQWGIYLTCLGVGMGNYKDSKLEVLAKKGNGNFAYLDDEREAEKVLVKEFTQTVFAVADDAYLNIDFNPTLVKDYRLVGFDNKLKSLSDSLNEVQGGEVGSGHSLLALFEISPADSESIAGTVAGPSRDENRIAAVTLNYKIPNDSLDRISNYNCPAQLTSFGDLPAPYRFATAVAMFGGMIKKSKYMRQVSWNDAILLGNNCYDPEDGIQREFLDMIEKARKIYGKERKRRDE